MNEDRIKSNSNSKGQVRPGLASHARHKIKHEKSKSQRVFVVSAAPVACGTSKFQLVYTCRANQCQRTFSGGQKVFV